MEFERYIGKLPEIDALQWNESVGEIPEIVIHVPESDEPWQFQREQGYESIRNGDWIVKDRDARPVRVDDETFRRSWAKKLVHL